jgi:hypothetical protein
MPSRTKALGQATSGLADLMGVNVIKLAFPLPELDRIKQWQIATILFNDGKHGHQHQFSALDTV